MRSPVVRFNAALTALPEWSAAPGESWPARATIDVTGGLEDAQRAFEACERGDPAVGFGEIDIQTGHCPQRTQRGDRGARRCAYACRDVIPATPPQPVTAACHSVVHHGVLPSWARAGFSSPRPRMPHVLGRSGDVVAIIFGYPLLSPPAKTRGNKILWVAREHDQPLGDLRITARLMHGRHTVGGHVVRVVRGGPGPSIVNLPARGCWRLGLRWSGRTDEVDLEYRARRR